MGQVIRDYDGETITAAFKFRVNSVEGATQEQYIQEFNRIKGLFTNSNSWGEYHVNCGLGMCGGV